MAATVTNEPDMSSKIKALQRMLSTARNGICSAADEIKRWEERERMLLGKLENLRGIQEND